MVPSNNPATAVALWSVQHSSRRRECFVSRPTHARACTPTRAHTHTPPHRPCIFLFIFPNQSLTSTAPHLPACTRRSDAPSFFPQPAALSATAPPAPLSACLLSPLCAPPCAMAVCVMRPLERSLPDRALGAFLPPFFPTPRCLALSPARQIPHACPCSIPPIDPNTMHTHCIRYP